MCYIKIKCLLLIFPGRTKKITNINATEMGWSAVSQLASMGSGSKVAKGGIWLSKCCLHFKQSLLLP